MAEARSDPDEERFRDLSQLRQLLVERAGLTPGSPEWQELLKLEAALARKIRQWGLEVDQAD